MSLEYVIPVAMDNEDIKPLIQLWLLRILHFDNTAKRFVKKDGFRDADVASALDLDDWVESAGEGTEKFDRAKVIELLRDHLEKAERSRCDLSAHFAHNCRLLAQVFGLNPIETKVCQFKIIEQQNRVLLDALRVARLNTRRRHIRLLAAALGEPVERIEPCVRSNSRLIKIGLLKWSVNRQANFELDFAGQELSERVLYHSCSEQDLIRDTMKLSVPPTLGYRNYPHLRETLGSLRQYIRCGLRERRRGLNVLIHGRPGTGKSELARVIAREMRIPLYEVSSEDAQGNPCKPRDRMNALVKAQLILEDCRALLAFDEAEDIFRGQSFFSRSLASETKAWTNQLLENNPVPVLWIANSINELESAFARRFDFIVKVPPPPREERLKIYRSLCGRRASNPILHKLADCEALTPAVVARAREVANRVCPTSAQGDFEQVLQKRVEQTLEAQGLGRRALVEGSPELPVVHDLRYLNCSLPLDKLGPALKQAQDCRICLYGPPGTGKTTFGHWLARQSGRRILLKKASDLLSPFLGETEHRIAMAFETAQRDKAILMIDEVDGFLRDRRMAQRSWEMQQVNELLSQMESFEGTFIASTNLMDGIDPAAMRRFDFKFFFDYLQADQIESLLTAYQKKLRLPRRSPKTIVGLADIRNVTPGDFANVARQHRYQPFANTQSFADAIARECQLKNEPSTKTLGFL